MSTLTVAPVSSLNLGASSAKTEANWSFIEATLRVTPSSGLADAEAPTVHTTAANAARRSSFCFESVMFHPSGKSMIQTIHQTKAHSSALDKICSPSECDKNEHY